MQSSAVTARRLSLATVMVMVAVSVLAACGSAHTTSLGSGETDVDGDAGGGGASSSTMNDGIYGSWIFQTSDDQGATAFQFKEDGTYLSVILDLTSSSSGESQAEAGNFTLAGGIITWTPTASTCPSPQPVYTTAYALNGDDLTVTVGDTVINFVPETTSSSGASSTTGSSSVTTGCFSSDGTSFTPAPLDPVTNR